jgi:hypothetical protein
MVVGFVSMTDAPDLTSEPDGPLRGCPIPDATSSDWRRPGTGASKSSRAPDVAGREIPTTNYADEMIPGECILNQAKNSLG